ncbi:MAG: aminopeptidase [Salinivirgaceae bacterium]|nr:aminopeptidase [Salinivirgaceae bacterium]
MKRLKYILSLLIVSSMFLVHAQESVNVAGYKLTKVVDLPTTSMKNQYRSGTCWSFSGLSFLEAELLRMGKDSIDLADMWLIKKDYHERAIDYVRFHGAISFGPGAESNDVMDMIKLYGIVPETEFPGLEYGEDKHVHGEFDAVLEAFVNAVLENKNKKLSTAWIKAFDNILDAYLGEDVDEFTYNGEKYTPESFRDAMGIVPDDYVELSSFTHHPFYTKFIMEVPDNWAFGELYNLPLDEFTDHAIFALDKGYTILWGADVSEEGFSHSNAIALIPQTDFENLAGSEKEKWESMSEKERNERLYDFSEPIPEKEITQKMRQKAFDDYRTQDDHGMHITGYYKTTDGKIFFKVKNSWGTTNDQDGYFYASEAYFKYKTIGIMVHKDALKEDVKKKMGLN